MISLIYASSINNVIGRNGKLPWHLSDDLKRFKRLTSDGCLVMGRKTWDSLDNKPLPGRSHVILTRNLPPSVVDIYDESSVLYVSTNDIEAFCRDILPINRDSWIIGGSHVFNQFLPYVDRIHWTRVEADVEGDTFFHYNPLEDKSFSLIDSETIFAPKDFVTKYSSTYMVFERK